MANGWQGLLPGHDTRVVWALAANSKRGGQRCTITQNRFAAGWQRVQLTIWHTVGTAKQAGWCWQCTKSGQVNKQGVGKGQAAARWWRSGNAQEWWQWAGRAEDQGDGGFRKEQHTGWHALAEHQIRFGRGLSSLDKQCCTQLARHTEQDDMGLAGHKYVAGGVA